jgi:hypothetical protein
VARIADFSFYKRGQQFIGAHNVTLSVAVRVGNPDCPAFVQSIILHPLQLP